MKKTRVLFFIALVISLLTMGCSSFDKNKKNNEIAMLESLEYANNSMDNVQIAVNFVHKTNECIDKATTDSVCSAMDNLLCAKNYIPLIKNAQNPDEKTRAIQSAKKNLKLVTICCKNLELNNSINIKNVAKNISITTDYIDQAINYAEAYKKFD